ncbi:unnamed protein product [Peniophora sp. CBMAI 1063]|nr:unnamed protein product [Peniophora sp. CBMAI 1063]
MADASTQAEESYQPNSKSKKGKHKTQIQSVSLPLDQRHKKSAYLVMRCVTPILRTASRIEEMYKKHKEDFQTWDPKVKSYTLQYLYRAASTWTPPTAQVDESAAAPIESGNAEEAADYFDSL